MARPQCMGGEGSSHGALIEVGYIHGVKILYCIVLKPQISIIPQLTDSQTGFLDTHNYMCTCAHAMYIHMYTCTCTNYMYIIYFCSHFVGHVLMYIWYR